MEKAYELPTQRREHQAAGAAPEVSCQSARTSTSGGVALTSQCWAQVMQRRHSLNIFSTATGLIWHLEQKSSQSLMLSGAGKREQVVCRHTVWVKLSHLSSSFFAVILVNGETQSQNIVTCLCIIYGTGNSKQICYLLMLVLLWHWDTESSESGWTLLVQQNSSYRTK